MNELSIDEYLICPYSRQKLKSASPEQLRRLNDQLTNRRLMNRAGNIITENITHALVTEDDRWCYPIWGDIPALITDEGIDLHF